MMLPEASTEESGSPETLTPSSSSYAPRNL